MTQNRDFFTPESVDEQVEQLSSLQSAEPGGAPAQAEMRRVIHLPANKDVQDTPGHLVKALQAFYQADYEQNKASLARARRRIAAHQFNPYNINQAQSPAYATPGRRFFQERTRKMQSHPSMEQPKGRRQSRSLGLLAAVLAIGLLVGTLAVTLTLVHNQQGSHGIGGAKAPTPAPVGTILFTQKPPAGSNFGSAAWSPDGTRLAVSAIDLQTSQTQLDILDATSGKNLRTIPLDATSVGGVLWSPTGKYLALGNLQTIVIVNSQSGAVVQTINYSSPTASNVPSVSPLSWHTSKAPLGGGFGFYSMTWSPDGTSLAVAVSNVTTGSVELLDPQTGAVKTTFDQQAQPIGLSMSFSSDGKYLAVSYSNDSTIVVWDVATQQVAFTLGGTQSESIAWQPGTHNLARSAFNTNLAQGTSGSVELWDVDTQKLLKTYQGFSAFAWSSDGKELAAYTAPDLAPLSQIDHHITTNSVTILNADTGSRVGLYTSQNKIIASASWSPDGHSIVTNESTGTSDLIVVWAA